MNWLGIFTIVVVVAFFAMMYRSLRKEINQPDEPNYYGPLDPEHCDCPACKPTPEMIDKAVKVALQGDADKLRGDWEKVGGDMENAMKRAEMEGRK